MSLLQSRYNLVPQMEYYDQISCEFKPYVMFFNKKNFSSKTVNTDRNGFRLNVVKDKLCSLENLYNEEEVSLVIGGSTAFGFGSSSDYKTISSQLSILSNEIYINFGATAFNSMQELFLYINFFQKFKKIKNVIIISGVNDLFLSFSQKSDPWGNFFFKTEYEKLHLKKKKIKDKISQFFESKKNSNFKINIDYKDIDLSYEKIFNIWSNLESGSNFNVYYFLQPFPSWFNKSLTKEEVTLFNLLDNSDNKAHMVLNKISNNEIYQKYSNLIKQRSKHNSIKYIDLNQEILNNNKKNDWLFVDRVHMTDLGYSILAELIFNNLK